MNSVILIGRLTAKPELNYTPSSTAVTKFSIAVDRQTKEKEADFIRVTVFGKQAENLCRYKDKGDMVAINGRIQTGSYKKDGKTIYTQDVIANNVEWLGGSNHEQKADDIERKAHGLFGWQSSDDDLPY